MAKTKSGQSCPLALDSRERPFQLVQEPCIASYCIVGYLRREFHHIMAHCLSQSDHVVSPVVQSFLNLFIWMELVHVLLGDFIHELR